MLTLNVRIFLNNPRSTEELRAELEAIIGNNRIFSAVVQCFMLQLQGDIET
jgi:hypothetical protein